MSKTEKSTMFYETTIQKLDFRR